MEIKKIEKSDFVMFSRLRQRGVEPQHVIVVLLRPYAATWKAWVLCGR